MAIVSRDELKSMVGKIMPSTTKKPIAPNDATEVQKVRESLSQQAARQIREMGR